MEYLIELFDHPINEKAKPVDYVAYHFNSILYDLLWNSVKRNVSYAVLGWHAINIWHKFLSNVESRWSKQMYVFLNKTNIFRITSVNKATSKISHWTLKNLIRQVCSQIDIEIADKQLPTMVLSIGHWPSICLLMKECCPFVFN